MAPGRPYFSWIERGSAKKRLSLRMAWVGWALSRLDLFTLVHVVALSPQRRDPSERAANSIGQMGHQANQLGDELAVDLVESADVLRGARDIGGRANGDDFCVAGDELDHQLQTNRLREVFDSMQGCALSSHLDVVDLSPTAAHDVGDLELAEPEPPPSCPEPLTDTCVLHV